MGERAAAPAWGRPRWSRRVALALQTRLGIGGAAFRNAERETEVDAGYTGIWRRDTLLRHGGWDQRWPINEDGELAARVREAGGRIVCVPEMAAQYVPRDSLGALARQYFRYGIYRAKTCGAHPKSMRRSHLLPPALVVAVSVAALGAGWPVRLARAGIAAYLIALVGTGGLPARHRGSGRLLVAGGAGDHASELGLRVPGRVRPLRPAAAGDRDARRKAGK